MPSAAAASPPVLTSRIRDFLRMEASGGIMLAAAAALALLISNSALRSAYVALLETPVSVRIGSLLLDKPLLLWVNDGLMAVFFFLVGLEIKREVLKGELSSLSRAALPIFAAIGGMAVPALIYAGVNWNNAEALRGWAIPAATDIAFALGILAVLGRRVPVSLKVFLLAVAIIDDLGAIVIIALFYTSDLSLLALGLASGGLVILIGFNVAGVRRAAPYLLIGIVMWVCVLKSGVHATLAGVLVALTIPMRATSEEAPAPLYRIEHGLHPWVAFLILPVFAFANAGVSFAGLTPAALLAPVPLGILLGLFVGKQLGVMGASWLAVRAGLARLPEGLSWAMLYGAACLTGVGFTMSLFIGSLAFETPEQRDAVRLGVVGGSLLSALLGYGVLRLASRLHAGAAQGGRPALSS